MAVAVRCEQGRVLAARSWLARSRQDCLTRRASPPGFDHASRANVVEAPRTRSGRACRLHDLPLAAAGPVAGRFGASRDGTVRNADWRSQTGDACRRKPRRAEYPDGNPDVRERPRAVRMAAAG